MKINKSFMICATIAVLTAAVAKSENSSMMGSMHKMSMDMSQMKMTGNPDKDFLNMMIIHHQGAVEMAKVEVQTGHDSKLKALAQKMIDDQSKEIKMMQEWPTTK